MTRTLQVTIPIAVVSISTLSNQDNSLLSLWLCGIALRIKKEQWAWLALALASSPALLSFSIVVYLYISGCLPHAMAMVAIFHPRFRKEWSLTLILGLLTIEVSWHAYELGKTVFLLFFLAAFFREKTGGNAGTSISETRTRKIISNIFIFCDNSARFSSVPINPLADVHATFNELNITQHHENEMNWLDEYFVIRHPDGRSKPFMLEADFIMKALLENFNLIRLENEIPPFTVYKVFPLHYKFDELPVSARSLITWKRSSWDSLAGGSEWTLENDFIGLGNSFQNMA